MTRTIPSSAHVHPGPGRLVRAVGFAMALWCFGFAVVNVFLEVTGDYLDDGPYAAYASGFAVMNWSVVALKPAGGAVALHGAPVRNFQRIPLIT